MYTVTPALSRYVKPYIIAIIQVVHLPNLVKGVYYDATGKYLGCCGCLILGFFLARFTTSCVLLFLITYQLEGVMIRGVSYLRQMYRLISFRQLS